MLATPSLMPRVWSTHTGRPVVAPENLAAGRMTGWRDPPRHRFRWDIEIVQDRLQSQLARTCGGLAEQHAGGIAGVDENQPAVMHL
ncbi:MAG: hypothetical protein R3D03_15670 [Geminicoccaceae bacterium]